MHACMHACIDENTYTGVPQAIEMDTMRPLLIKKEEKASFTMLRMLKSIERKEKT